MAGERGGGGGGGWVPAESCSIRKVIPPAAPRLGLDEGHSSACTSLPQGVAGVPGGALCLLGVGRVGGGEKFSSWSSGAGDVKSPTRRRRSSCRDRPVLRRRRHVLPALPHPGKWAGPGNPAEEGEGRGALTLAPPPLLLTLGVCLRDLEFGVVCVREKCWNPGAPGRLDDRRPERGRRKGHGGRSATFFSFLLFSSRVSDFVTL